MTGIYKIVNISNNKTYIGQSVDLMKRKRQHMNALRKDKHKNKEMQKDFNANPKSFRFSVVERCAEVDMNERECHWINHYDSYKKGYNRTVGGGYTREEEAESEEVKIDRGLSPMERLMMKGKK